MCNLLPHIHWVVISMKSKHKWFLLDFAEGMLDIVITTGRVTWLKTSDHKLRRSSLSRRAGNEVVAILATWFSQGLSIKTLTLSSIASARWWKGTDHSSSTGQNEEVLKANPYLMFWSEMRIFGACCSDNGLMSRKGTFSWHSAYSLWF